MLFNCQKCGKKFKAPPSAKRIFCSRSCMDHGLLAKTHGESRTRLYEIWSHIKTRCSCPTNVGFAYYGGRGISVCDEWARSFIAFRDWALANGYADDLEIDRKNTDGNYEPENCRWATRIQQMRNTRKRRDAETSRFKGVSLHSQNNRWIAQIGHKNRTIYIGSFNDELEAARAYDDEARRLFGEFAATNFTQGGVPR